MPWGRYNYGPHQMAFWDFVQSLDATNNPGVGVDHAAQGQPAGPGFQGQFGSGFPFGPGGGFGAWRGGPWGGPHHRGRWGGRGGGCGGGEGFRGHRGRHCHRGGAQPPQPNPEDPPAGGDGQREVNDPPTSVPENEKENSPDTLGADGPDGQPPHPHHPGGFPHRPHPHPHARFGPPPPPPYGAEGPPPPFDFRAMMQAFANHPFAQQLREYMQNAAGANNDNTNNNENEYGDEVFVPPLDIFDAETHWTVHIALPGAKKEDVGVNWDAEKSHLAVAGVVYRPGDEDFLKGLVGSGERKVGVFERNVRLPPAAAGGETTEKNKEEVDGEGIRARMEDGILIVFVPKVEKEDWTEVRKVDIE